MTFWSLLNGSLAFFQSRSPCIKVTIFSLNLFFLILHREGVMEFLLANHPLDCPICDQGGECDLQVNQR